jgi:hypothetical protein
MTDKQAKAALRTWPEKLGSTWPTPDEGGRWLRARPKDGHETRPALHSPGVQLFKTQPDGLWLYINNPIYADAICIEVCGSIQNLNDKRSRYFPSSHSMMVTCPKPWLLREINSGQGTKPIWKYAKGLNAEPAADVVLPIRLLRVLYALKSDHYDRWAPNHVPTGYEFFCVDTSLRSFSSPKMQAFLKQMSVGAQFYTKPYG